MALKNLLSSSSIRPNLLRHCLAARPLLPAPSIRTHAIATGATIKSLDGRPKAAIPSVSDAKVKISRRAALKDAKPFSAFLTDSFNRQHDYLRISITERCNLRCQYCMPEEGVQLSPQRHLLTAPEILYLSSLFVSEGVTKIRLTGGEPTVHPQILPLLRDIGELKKHGLQELAITTNGVTLPRKLDSMIQSGVTGINLSLDTLDPFQFQIMTRRKGFEQVMKSISLILEAKRLGAPMKLKVNAVIIRGVNDSQIMQFVEMTKEKDLEVRFIEYMPFQGNKWSSQKMLTYQEMLAIIREHFPAVHKVQGHLNDTSKTYQIPGFAGKLGFITSMTENFCGSCNRLRITSDGNLKVCLFGNAEVSLKDMLRKNLNNGDPIDEAAWEAIKQVESDRREGRVVAADPASQEKEMELLEVIGMAVKRKKERHAGVGQLEHMKNRPMILIDQPPLLRPVTLPLHSFPSLCLPSFTGLRSQIYSNGSRAFSTFPFTRFPKIQHTLENKHNNANHDTDSDTTSGRLTHLTSRGQVHMVHIPPTPSSPSPQPDAESASGKTKPATARTAVARAHVIFSNREPLSLVRSAALKKGDVLSVARIAGIMASKKTSDIIPLCHNIPLSGVQVDAALALPRKPNPGDAESTEPGKRCGGGKEGEKGEEEEEEEELYAADAQVGEFGGISVTATVHTFGQTGVEMEALTAASTAALTVYDMCKGVDRGMRIEGLRVVLKEGGRSGTWSEAKLK